VETSDGAVVASETVDRPSSSGRRDGGGRETDRFLVRAVEVLTLFLEFLELSSELFLGGLPRIVRAMAVSCCRCCSNCDSGSKGRRDGAGFVAVFCDDFLILNETVCVCMCRGDNIKEKKASLFSFSRSWVQGSVGDVIGSRR
jgi:hypothetical protein